MLKHLFYIFFLEQYLFHYLNSLSIFALAITNTTLEQIKQIEQKNENEIFDTAVLFHT